MQPGKHAGTKNVHSGFTRQGRVTPGSQGRMSIFLFFRMYAASLFHTSGWGGLAIALRVRVASICLGELALLIGHRAKGSQQPSINTPFTCLKEITHGMV